MEIISFYKLTSSTKNPEDVLWVDKSEVNEYLFINRGLHINNRTHGDLLWYRNHSYLSSDVSILTVERVK